MNLGAIFPTCEIGEDPAVIRDWAQTAEGLGYSHMLVGDPKNTEPYRAALLSFLRVFLETPGVGKETVAEALYQGAQSADKWRGPDSGAMARRLCYIEGPLHGHSCACHLRTLATVFRSR